MRRPHRLMTLVFWVLCLLEAVSVTVAVSVNASHGRSEKAAFSRWVHDPTAENKRTFESEMDRLQREPRMIRRASLVFACVNGLALYLMYRRFRVASEGGRLGA